MGSRIPAANYQVPGGCLPLRVEGYVSPIGYRCVLSFFKSTQTVPPVPQSQLHAPKKCTRHPKYKPSAVSHFFPSFSFFDAAQRYAGCHVRPLLNVTIFNSCRLHSVVVSCRSLTLVLHSIVIPANSRLS